MGKSKPDAPNTKFDAKLRRLYLEHLRKGNLKFEAARLVGVSYRTVERRRADDEEFRLAEQHAMAEAREGVEKVLHQMALEGDLGAIKMWLTAHDRSTYGDKRKVEIDATPEAVALGQADALARIAELQRTLAERQQRLALDDDPVLDLPSEELPAPGGESSGSEGESSSSSGSRGESSGGAGGGESSGGAGEGEGEGEG